MGLMTSIIPTPRKRKEDQEFKIFSVSKFEGSLGYVHDKEEEEKPK